jgi:hypothetical protein
MRPLFTGNGGGGNDSDSDNQHNAPEAMTMMFDHFANFSIPRDSPSVESSINPTRTTGRVPHITSVGAGSIDNSSTSPHRWMWRWEVCGALELLAW